MYYAGGKKRNGGPIIEILQADIDAHRYAAYVEPFMGALGIARAIKHPVKLLSDKHPGLAQLYIDIASGALATPDDISLEEYEAIKRGPYDSLHVLVGFACSWGGKWWRGYAKAHKSSPYRRQGSIKHTWRDVAMCGDATYSETDYTAINSPAPSLIYCDPPYAGTTPYACDRNFDHDAFWAWAREMSRIHTVYVSEYTAPDDVCEVWSKSVARYLNKDSCSRATERLFRLAPDDWTHAAPQQVLL